MQNLFVIEDFYTAENFGLMSNFQRTCNMKGLHVPQNIYYPSRLEAFPTWESDDFEKDQIDKAKDYFVNALINSVKDDKDK